ncbi:MAG TPA: hypothetical protein VN175_12545 [Rhizomicrobium sp.]|nr:hypothetical protein [Rhizomicrobium sp.]
MRGRACGITAGEAAREAVWHRPCLRKLNKFRRYQPFARENGIVSDDHVSHHYIGDMQAGFAVREGFYRPARYLRGACKGKRGEKGQQHIAIIAIQKHRQIVAGSFRCQPAWPSQGWWSCLKHALQWPATADRYLLTGERSRDVIQVILLLRFGRQQQRQQKRDELGHHQATQEQHDDLQCQRRPGKSPYVLPIHACHCAMKAPVGHPIAHFRLGAHVLALLFQKYIQGAEAVQTFATSGAGGWCRRHGQHGLGKG